MIKLKLKINLKSGLSQIIRGIYGVISENYYKILFRRFKYFFLENKYYCSVIILFLKKTLYGIIDR